MVVTELNGEVLILSADDSLLDTIKEYDDNAKIVEITDEEYYNNRSDLVAMRELVMQKLGEMEQN